MHTDQTERLAAARLDLLTTSTAPPEVGPDTPIECIEPDQLELLTERLLEDWDDPRFSELGLCRAHRLSLVQLRAVAALPSFRAALTHIRALRADRRPDVDARARAMAIDGLCELAQHKPVNATFAQQIRIALQTLLRATTNKPDATDAPGPVRPAETRAQDDAGSTENPATPQPQSQPMPPGREDSPAACVCRSAPARGPRAFARDSAPPEPVEPRPTACGERGPSPQDEPPVPRRGAQPGPPAEDRQPAESPSARAAPSGNPHRQPALPGTPRPTPG